MRQILQGLAIQILLFVIAGCAVNDAYDFQKGIDTEVTVFSEGVTIPLGETKPIYLKDLIRTDGEDSIIESTDNGYAINVTGEMDLAKNIPDLKSQIPAIDNIPPINSSFKYHIGCIDAEDFSIEATTLLDMKYSTSEDYSISALEAVQVNETKTWMAGLDSYSSTLSGTSLTLPGCSVSLGFIDPDISGWIGLLQDNEDIDIPDELIMDTKVDKDWPVNCNIEFDDIIKGIKSISLSPDSKMKVSVKIENPVFTAGNINLAASLDVSKLLKISGVNGPIDLSSLSLSSSNGYSDSKEYNVESVVINDSDWDSVNHSLNLERTVSLDGELIFSGVKTNKSTFNTAQAKGDMSFKIDISFNGFSLSDAEVALNDVKTDQKENIDVPIQEITLPDAVKSVDWIEFDKTKDLVLTATAGKIPSGIEFVVDKLTMEFPSSISVEGAHNGVLEYTDLAISSAPGNTVSKNIHLDRITFPQANSGKISISDKIKVRALAHACTAEGKHISLSSLPKEGKDDMSLTFSLKGSLEVGDFLIHLANPEEFGFSDTFEMMLPDECKDFGNFAVTPKGSPKLGISISAPDVFAEGSGVIINFPPFLRLTDLSADSRHSFDPVKNTVRFDKGTFPGELTFSVDKLDMAPIREDGKYKIKGTIGFTSPKLIPESGELTKELFDKLTSKDIEAKAEIDAIVPRDIQLTKFNIPVDEQTFPIELFKAGDIPEELLSINNITLAEPVLLNLSLKAVGLPELEDGNKFHVALDITFPGFLSVENADAGNHIKLEGDIVDGKLSLAVKILTLDLNGIDLSKELSGDIKVEGSVSVDNPKFALNSLAEDIDVEIKGTVSPVKLRSAQIHVDYKLDPVRYAISLENLHEIIDFEDAVLDIVNPSLSLDIESNMGIPIGGELKLCAYRANAVIREAKISLDNLFPYTTDPKATKNSKIYLAQRPGGCPEGYTWKEVDLAGLIRDIPDSLVIFANIEVDKEKPCYLDLSADYILKFAYGFNIPLEFGSDFYVAVKDTMKVEGMGDLLKNAVIGLGVEAQNSIPLNLGVSIAFIDGNENIVPSEYPICGEIRAGDENGNPVTSKFEVSTATADGAHPGSIEGLVFTVAIKGSPDCTRAVSEKDFAKIKLIAMLPEGFTYKYDTEKK